MKKILGLFVLLVLSSSFSARASVLRGDVNGSGTVTIDDVTALIDYLLNEDASGISLAGADCNQNGTVTIDDVTSLIDYLLSDSWPEAAHEWVDLGLPSHTLWATRNIGADNPEDYGYHFSWGDIEPMENYPETGKPYKWTNNNGLLTKYNTMSSCGIVDNKTELDLEDDAAFMIWGPSWRMPSLEQIQELCDYCSWQFTQLNGVNGCMVTGLNGKTMFLPAAGIVYFSNWLSGVEQLGTYWSRMLDPNDPEFAYQFWFVDPSLGDDSVDVLPDRRQEGKSVRPVRVP